MTESARPAPALGRSLAGVRRPARRRSPSRVVALDGRQRRPRRHRARSHVAARGRRARSAALRRRHGRSARRPRARCGRARRRGTRRSTTTVRTAADLGLELAVATSSGWSAAGDPWVEPVDAMKKVVWSETVDRGWRRARRRARRRSRRWRDPSRTAHAGGRRTRPEWSTDWKVVAIPARAAHDALHPGVGDGLGIRHRLVAARSTARSRRRSRFRATRMPGPRRGSSMRSPTA